MKWLSALFIAGTFTHTAVHAEANLSNWRNFSGGAVIAETTGVAPGHKAQIGIKIKTSPEWHTYWVNPGDSGEPLSLKIETKPASVVVTEVKFPTPERIETESLVSFAYSNEVLFPIEFSVPKLARVGSTVHFKIDAQWLICQKVCIPAVERLEITLPIEKLEDIKPSEDFRLFQRVQEALPVPTLDGVEAIETEETVRLKFPQWSNNYEFVDFMPYRGAGLKNIKPTVLKKDPLELEFQRSKVKKANIGLGLLIMRTPDTNIMNAWTWGNSGWTLIPAAKNLAKDVWWILISAFIGGLILNSMPCVFPILSMKLLSLVKLTQSSHGHVVKQNLAYTFGVIISFLSIGLMILGLRHSGQLVGWGFQLQSPVFVSVLVWLFVVLALQLVGLFEFDFLDLNMGHKLTKKQGWTGSFFTGVLAVIVASPCTAPFMGVAIGFALVAQWWILMAIFFMLGLGLAFPYLVFSLFPPVVRFLPKPGPWMKLFKEIMAIPLVLTAAWLLWLVGQLGGMLVVAAVLIGCAVLCFAVWQSRSRKSRTRKTGWTIAAVVLVICSVWIYRQDGSQIKVADGIWREFRPGIEDKFKGEIVFIDFTADWCLACKVNEKVVLETDEIQKFFRDHKVVLIKGDWTQRNPEITKFLRKHERAGVPFYILFSPQFPDGKILAEVLSKDIVKNAILGKAD
jgi:DsbC/DsbD-like thiol-disulfide interchange protein